MRTIHVLLDSGDIWLPSRPKFAQQFASHFMTELRMRNGINLSEPLALDEKMARMR